MIGYFKKQIPLRRQASGDDLFSHLCRAAYEDGRHLRGKKLRGDLIAGLIVKLLVKFIRLHQA